jgi:hypothetical protein
MLQALKMGARMAPNDPIDLNDPLTHQTQRVRIYRESAAIHDLILWLDEPAGIWWHHYIGKYLFSKESWF